MGIRTVPCLAENVLPATTYSISYYVTVYYNRNEPTQLIGQKCPPSFEEGGTFYYGSQMYIHQFPWKIQLDHPLEMGTVVF